MLKKIIKIDKLLNNKLSKYSNNFFITIISKFGNIILTLFIIFILFYLPIIENKKIAIISIVSLILNTIIVFILKYSIQRKRAFTDNDIFNKFDPYSFPSGHISRLSGFIIPTISIPFLFFVFIILSISVSIARIIKGYHFLSDCIAGFIIGLGTGFVSLIFSGIYLDFIIDLFKKYII